jgi:hypothetical protein
LIDGAGDLGQGVGNGEGDGGVFGVDEVGDVERGFAVEVVGGLVGLLGAETAERGGLGFQVGPFGSPFILTVFLKSSLRGWFDTDTSGAKARLLFDPNVGTTKIVPFPIDAIPRFLNPYSGLRLLRCGIWGGVV